jgi:hypothetical protein
LKTHYLATLVRARKIGAKFKEQERDENITNIFHILHILLKSFAAADPLKL